MATYVIGDIQGCARELDALLRVVRFAPAHDRLWLTGDLVNRGPDSLGVLRRVRALGDAAVTVLGNHDLHLLAIAHVRGHKQRRRDTLGDVLAAPDRDELLAWLRRQPLLHHDAALGVTMVHAGLPPQWSLAESRAHAAEVEAALRDDAGLVAFLEHMYGDTPARWETTLGGRRRLRFITNCLTRMRYCRADGSLDLAAKGAPGSQDAGLLPWYAVPARRSRDTVIVFGHWSTLRLDAAACRQWGVYPLDTGAVWGDRLTALRLEDRALFSVGSSLPVSFE
ncbi:MAG: symmetrical bis(5'-nucleosyl)-tetraphosphatase [Gammaproteobacteria bacterium]|nr:symmetrical bis(5'-nucleosyl)-tetraphosphatase [Gammaproteobacteria bacterium]MCP5201422.1 symmetrical bis(5'-nucleosyl)-tetraphosphatase [Gammaproteobacteria bacterium]